MNAVPTDPTPTSGSARSRVEGLLPTHTIPGTGREAGRAFGESARDLIVQHQEIVLRRLASKGMPAEQARAGARPFRDVTWAACPELAAEVDGVGEGAGLTQEDAWVLQLRAELLKLSEPEANECSSLAITEGTPRGGVLAGQNVDLPPDYADLFVLLRREPPDGPALATVTPAGQLGHHGMNEAGVSVFANFLYGRRCHLGVPRYLLTRIALACSDRHQALEAISAVPRSKPRNLLLADDTGAVVAETTPERVDVFHPEHGVLSHTNHFVDGPDARETPDPQLLGNSRTRLERLESLTGSPEFERSVPGVARVLADRANAPDAICHRADDNPALDVATVMMTIADVRARELWISPGGPEGRRLQLFAFDAGLRSAAFADPGIDRATS